VTGEQIKSNYRDEYNVPYLKSLKEIYVIEKDDENLAKVLSVLFPYTFEFDDYLFIVNSLSEEERKKWRTKILSRARNASRGRQHVCHGVLFQTNELRKRLYENDRVY